MSSLFPASGTPTEVPWNRKRRKPVVIAGMILGYAAMLAACVFVVLPFIWMVLASLKDNNEIFVVPTTWFPNVWHWEHYIEIWKRTDSLVWILNTALYALASTIIQVFTSSLAAYGFSRIRFPGRDTLFVVYIATMAVPWQAYMIPQFKMMSSMHLNDTRLSVILLQAFSTFGVFMMKQFYDTIPEELSEAARIDGLNEFRIFTGIIARLSGPSIAALSIITFTGVWNDYMGPLLYLRSPNLYNIQLGLQTFIGQYSTDYAMIMTGSVLSVLPILVVFLFGQRYFIQGIATSGMKG